MIADSECNENKREQLLMAYHDQFKRTLIDLGYLGPRPTLMDIQKEVLKNGLTGEEEELIAFVAWGLT